MFLYIYIKKKKQIFAVRKFIEKKKSTKKKNKMYKMFYWS